MFIVWGHLYPFLLTMLYCSYAKGILNSSLSPFLCEVQDDQPLVRTQSVKQYT